jgi:hypothetical protein
MYSFLYYYLYHLALKRNPDTKFSAAAVVVGAQIGHFLLLSAILKIFIKLPVLQFSDVYLYNKLAWMPFALIWLIITHIYFKSKFEVIEKKYADQNMLNLKNGIIVCCLIFPPFIIAIAILTNV